jgi:HNH endonuclease
MCKHSAGTLRKLLQAREHGICQKCGLDTVQLLSRLQCRHRGERKACILQAAPAWAETKGTLEAAERLAKRPNPGNAWQADHVKAVYQGGGLCDVSNLQTLCTVCHQKRTREQASKRGRERRAMGTTSITSFAVKRNAPAAAAKPLPASDSLCGKPRKRRRALRSIFSNAAIEAAKTSVGMPPCLPASACVAPQAVADAKCASKNAFMVDMTQ